MDYKFVLTGKQQIAWKAMTNDQDCSVMFGGAKGGGKSWFLCLWIFYWSKMLMDKLQVPKDVKYPVAVGFVGRKRSVDFTKTTMETWKKIIPPDSYEIREQDKEIIIEKRVKVSFGGLDDQDNINKFNSAEFAFIAIDQAEETTRADVSVLQASLRLRYNSITPPYKELYTANPADCWLKEDFVYGKWQAILIKKNYRHFANLAQDCKVTQNVQSCQGSKIPAVHSGVA